MPQNTAPDPYYSDQTEVRPKSRDGESTCRPPLLPLGSEFPYQSLSLAHYKSNKKVFLSLLFFRLVKDEARKIIILISSQPLFRLSSSFLLLNLTSALLLAAIKRRRSGEIAGIFSVGEICVRASANSNQFA